MLVQIKQLQAKVTEQKSELKGQDKLIKKFQKKELQEQTQMAIADINGGATFVPATIAPVQRVEPPKVIEEKTKPEEKKKEAEPSASQGEAQTADPGLDNDLQVIAEDGLESADNSLKNTGGLYIDEQVNSAAAPDTVNDLQEYGRRSSLDYDDGFNNQYDDRQPGVVDDIIDPMEGAQIYQGSFQECALADYRSQGSFEEIPNVPPAEVDV